MKAGQATRAAERAKYIHVYKALPSYAMGGQRKIDAGLDLLLAYKRGCLTYLDIGCGRGEMLKIARDMGFEVAYGTEIVPELCNHYVEERAIDDLAVFPAGAYDCVSSFDVIEHVAPDDDRLLVAELGRIASKHLILTANNMPSVDPTTGNDLHINKRAYSAVEPGHDWPEKQDWDSLIREILEPAGWSVVRSDGAYVSATWHAVR